MFYVWICCLIQVIVAKEDDISIIRAKRQNNFCTNGGVYLYKSCSTSTDCNNIASVAAVCNNGYCCTAGAVNTVNQTSLTSCPSGYQSLGISCQDISTCTQATTSPVICQNGLCCLTSSMSNGNGNFNTGTCSNGGQSIGISCQSDTTCQQATTSQVTCQNGLCCLTSGVLPSTGNGNTFNTGICPIGYQALGLSCQYVSTCQTFVGSTSSNSVTCQNGQCCQATTSNNLGSSACQGGQSIGITCQSVSTCQLATNSPVTCQNGLCCLT
uniref:Uncharacterized protein n=1 Tax=Acrobeloides nanus TaxID=290746 RepID=A0A914DKD5_9BILA